MSFSFAHWIRNTFGRAHTSPIRRQKLNCEPLEARDVPSFGTAGTEFRVNTTTASFQFVSSVGVDADGDFVVAWMSQGQDGSGYGIYAQRYSAVGTTLGTEFRVNTYTTSNQGFPSVGVDADGDFVVAWQSAGQDGSGLGIYAQRYSAAGTPLGTEFRVNTYTTSDQGAPSVGVDADGDFVIAWNSHGQDGSGPGIYAQRYSAAGTPLGTEFRVNTYTTNEQSSPSVGVDADGDFVIAWQSGDQDGSGSGTYAQRYNSAGVAQGSEFRVNTYTTDNQYAPSVGVDADGDFVIAWYGNGQGDISTGIFARRYDSLGVAQGDEFHVNTYTPNQQDSPSVGVDADGDFVIAWQSGGQDGSSYGIYAQRYSAAGVALGSEFLVNTDTTSGQYAPSVGVDADGDFVIAWYGNGQTDSYGIYAQRYADLDNNDDTAGPTVTGVWPTGAGVPLDPDKQITGGERLVGDVPGLRVGFSEDLAAIVTDLANWRLTRNGVDVSALITGVTFAFNATARKYVATAALSAPLSDGVYALTVRFGVTDAAGNGLDGRPDGTPTREDFVHTFTIARPAPAGPEFRANTYTTSIQFNPSVGVDADGDYVVAWSSYGQDGSGYGIYAQRYSAAGVAQGTEFRVNTYTTSGQSAPSVGVDADGDFVIAWASYGQDGSGSGVYAQRYSSAGTPLGTEFRVNTYTTDYQTAPSVGVDADGDFIVAWQSYDQDGSGYGIYAQRYSAAGVALGSEFRVNTYTTSFQFEPSVGVDADGDFVVAWASDDQDGSSYGIYAQRYSAAGVALGSEFRVNTYTTSFQFEPSVGVDADGDFVIAWQSYQQDGSGFGVYAQRYSAAGSPLGSEFRVNSYTTNSQAESSVGVDADGDFVIAWRSYGQDGSNYGVYAQRYSAAGVTQGSEFRVNTYTTNSQRNPSVGVDADGDFVVAWESGGQDGSDYGIYAQRYAQTAVVSEVRGSGDPSPIDPGETLLAPIAATNGLTVRFSTAMNAASVSNTANWSLAVDPLGVAASVTSVTYDAPTRTAALTFSTALTVGRYTLTAKGTLLDADSRPLDGDFDGAPGGDFVRTFTVTGVTPAGPEFRANTFTTGNQSDSSVGVDADGDFVIAWTSGGQDGSGYGIYAQRYNAAGTPLGTEFRVNTFTTGFQGDLSVGVDADGDFVIAWTSGGQDGSSYGVYAQQYNSSGTPLGGEFRANTFTTGSQSNPSVSVDADGDFVVAWQSYDQDSSSFGVYAQRYSAAGAPLGAEFRVNTTVGGSQASPSVGVDADGDFVVAWMSNGQDGSGLGIYAQRYSATGAPLGAEFRVNATAAGSQSAPSVGVDADGDFVIAWQSYDQDGGMYGIYAQRYSAAGAPLGAEFRVNTTVGGSQSAPSVGVDADGDFVIAWTSGGQDGSGYGIYAQRYNAAGTPLGTEFRVNTFTTGFQGDSSVGVDADGDFVIAWLSGGQDGSGYGIYAQRYETNRPPVITNNGGGTTASVSVAENTTAVTTVTAADPDLPVQTLTYSLSGLDGAKFAITSGGVLTFVSAPDFESPTDNGGNNVYDVTVTVSDGAGGTVSQAIAVTVTGVNDNDPVITSNGGNATAAVSVAENTTAVTSVTATDADLPAQTFTYALSGTDAARFTISSSGVLTFAAAPDFEAPTDSGANNVYEVTVTVTDSGSPARSDTQVLTVTVTAVNDNDPVITSNGGNATASVSVAENATAVAVVTQTDADQPAQTFTYSLSGPDAARFTISASGVLTFASAPDFEAPTDTGGNNVYDVIVTVTDSGSPARFDAQAIAVTVANTNEPATITGTATGAVTEDGTLTAGNTLVVSDPDAGQSSFQSPGSLAGTYGTFSFNPATGAWGYTLNNATTTVQALRAAQTVTDTLTVTSFDGTASRAITVTITGANDTAAITGTATGFVTEDGPLTTNGMVTANDADATEARFQSPGSLTGTYGTFTFNPTTGAWGYTLNNTLPAVQALATGETLTDMLAVTSFDGTSTRQLTVTINGTIDRSVVPPVTVDRTEGNAATDLSASGTLTLTTVDNPPPTFVPQSAAAGLYGTFALDAAGNWAYTASSAHDEFVGGTTYTDVFPVTTTDGAASSVTVRILGTNDGPVAQSGMLSVTEDVARTGAATATDVDTPAAGLTFALVGANGGATRGTVTMAADGSFTYTPTANTHGSDSFTFAVSDGSLSGTAVVSVTVAAANDDPTVVTPPAPVIVNEDAAPVTVYVGSAFADPDVATAGDVLTLSVTGNTAPGVVSAAVVSGQLVLTFAPDANGPATITVRATDTAGRFAETQVAVTVDAVNDVPLLEPIAGITVAQDSGAFARSEFASFKPGGGADEVGQTATYNVTNDNSDLFAVQPAIGPDGTLVFALKPGANGVATVTVSVTDSGGTANGGRNTSAVRTFTVTATAAPPVPAVAPGSSAGRVQLVNPTTGAVVRDFFPFGLFTGGVQTAVADVTGDGIPDVVAVTASRIGVVAVYDGATGGLVRAGLPFGLIPSGLQVAAADLDGDGSADIILAPSVGLPVAVALSGRTGQVIRVFGGVQGAGTGAQLAVGDVTGDGTADVVLNAGGLVTVFDGANGALVSGFSFVPGATLGVGDLDGDGKGEIVGAVPGVGSLVGLSARGQLVRAYPAAGAPGPVRRRIEAVADFTGDRVADLLVSDSLGQFGRLVLIDGASGAVVREQFTSDPLFPGGPAV